MSKHQFEAVIFDLDGVITKTANVHNRAWKKMFDDYLKSRAEITGMLFEEFTSEDYLNYVDGKPRYDGVKSFLATRKINLPFGTPDDDPEMETVCGLGNRKNIAFNEVLRLEGVEAYPSTVKLLELLKKDGIRIGVASSSKNAESVLAAAGLTDFIETRVDGVVSAEIGLKGKPAPDIFVTAARNLGVDPHKAIVVEDASSGVMAGKNGNFGLVIGLAREDNVEVLKANGADIVVKDLSELSIEEIDAWFVDGLKNDGWTISFHGYDPIREKSREALLTVGNGFFGTRGAMEETSAGDSNYPGTYIAGVYNRLITKIADRDIENEDFVNVPNWLKMTFRIEDGAWFNPNEVTINKLSRQLDFRNGLLSRSMEVTDARGHRTKIESLRIASMSNMSLAALKYRFTPLNYSARVSFMSSLDGTHINDGVKRYSTLNQQHLEPIEQGGEGSSTYLKVRTTQSHIRIAEAAKLKFRTNNTNPHVHFDNYTGDGLVSTVMNYEARQGETIEIEKLVSIQTNQFGEDDIHISALWEIDTTPSFEELLFESAQSWSKIWKEIDIKISGDRISQKLIRMHLYHLMVSASPNNVELDASVTARGLHGEAYRGHIFWDELYILPFYNIHMPEVAKSMLLYRYRRLEKAREYAKEYGYEGAMFPWQSGSDGREETQVVHLNPLSGEWGEDHSSLQRHVSLAVAFNVWQYFHITEDIAFIEEYGAEMFLEICRFWASKCELNPETGKYSIKEVMGPDEFHEMYPGAEKGGLTDNAYTNIMVSWMMSRVPVLLNKMSEAARKKVFTKISLGNSELIKWDDIHSKLRLVISDEGIISQYDGYFDLEELDWDYYREKYQNIYRMDRLLRAEGKSADNYKVAKQADTLMTFYNLEKTQVDKIIADLEYHLPEDYLVKNLEYYLARTSHGSTLSRVVHAQLAEVAGNRELSWELYSDALASDYNDIQGGTTAEGIHAGVMAGTIMIALTTFAGVDLRNDIIAVNPALPDNWKKMSFNLKFKNTGFHFELDHKQVRITTNKDIQLIVKGELVNLKAGVTLVK